VKKQQFRITLLKEIAQNWFGILTTVKWWDDLWLIRAFTQYASYLCLEEAKGLEEFRGSQIHFLDEYFTALEQDQKDTTHPIQ